MPRLSKIGAAALAAFGWTAGGATTVTASYLQVAGGGGGCSAGGGAGGYLTGTTTLDITQSYTVIVGAGGARGTTTIASNGSNSQFGTLTASVGGGGSGYQNNGSSGGSGGGGGGSASTTTGGAGTSGQGNAGGGNAGITAPNYPGGGGGGAGAAGTNASGSTGGSGGVGLASSISGTSTYYAGGGGAASGGTAGTGGNGGGGNGSNSTAGSPGTQNTGGGGGGGSGPSGGNGGSGIVVISYLLPQKFGGGVVTTDGTNCIHTFKTSGTLTPLSQLSADYLIVAGGGAGGDVGGGGGAGGLLTGSGLTIDTNSTYVVTVGAGGTASSSFSSSGGNGGNSSFSLVSTSAIGGGGGGSASTGAGVAGGSGGGGAPGNAGGAATSGQGYAGGAGLGAAPGYPGGGGGGAGAVGQTAPNGTTGGAGGIGVSSSISGTATYYAGGGGGSEESGGTPGAGGSGGGGAGSASPTTTATSGTANTGGGGGSNGASGTSGSGGSGVFILRYAGSTQQMAGGTVTITGGYVIHTFTSSGYLTPLTYLNNSLRFRKSAGAYLSRTPSAAGNRKTWTFSAWVKRGVFGASGNNQFLFSCGTSYSQYGWMGMGFFDGNAGGTGLQFQLSEGANGAIRRTAAVLRDPASWYHLMVAFDSTQASDSNRAILYVNGIQQTLDVSVAITQNSDYGINQALSTDIGADAIGNVTNLDGYLAEVNFIDGQQLTPNAFGSFNSYGVWTPVKYSGSYGTNGFYLPFPTATTSSYAGSFSGTNYLSLGGTSALALGSGSWTIECWYYANSFGTYQVLYDGRPAGTNGAYPTMSIGNDGAVRFAVNATEPIVSAAGLVPLNKWVHVAVVKNGSTTTGYLNGKSIGSFTDTVTYLTGGVAPYIATNAFGPGNPTYSVNGYISNLRVVKGSAVYTSDFTPPTSPLTAVANTALLTLQNSTIIDNSTNALSITNNGSVTAPVEYPFSINVFNDQGPAGNNWTPVNISGVLGSTYDYMTDVPTLTSATAANYCVGNPLQTQAGGGFTDGNLTLSIANGSNYSRLFGTMGMTSGKFYWEFTQNVNAATLMGIAGSFHPATSAGTLGYYSDEYSYYGTGQKYNNGSLTSYGASYTTGDVIGVAFDATAGTLTFYKNGSSQGTAFSSIPAGTYFPAAGSASGTSTGYWNFGQQPFAYTPPAGFVGLNAYNM